MNVSYEQLKNFARTCNPLDAMPKTMVRVMSFWSGLKASFAMFVAFSFKRGLASIVFDMPTLRMLPSRDDYPVEQKELEIESNVKYPLEE